MNEKLWKKSKWFISQLLSALDYQTWVLINAKTHYVYQILCANNMKIVSRILIKPWEIREKNNRKMKEVYQRISAANYPKVANLVPN